MELRNQVQGIGNDAGTRPANDNAKGEIKLLIEQLHQAMSVAENATGDLFVTLDPVSRRPDMKAESKPVKAETPFNAPVARELNSLLTRLEYLTKSIQFTKSLLEI